jgi:hypothetical protein
MLEAAGVPIWKASRAIHEFRVLADQMAKDMGPDNKITEVEVSGERLFAEPFIGKGETFGTAILADAPDLLPMFSKQMDRVMRLMREDAKLGDIAAAVHELQNRAEDELETLMFYMVKSEHVKYCMLTEPFGSEINNRFPAAIDDIEGASRCLGLGQGTGCVLHLMRVMEVGLKALALPLGIPYAPSWESYLKQIADRIATKHKSKAVKWKRDEHFYRDISGDLVTIKTAWRNPTMHVGRKYSADEAEEIFIAVKRFMYRLAVSDPLIQKKKAAKP